MAHPGHSLFLTSSKKVNKTSREYHNYKSQPTPDTKWKRNGTNVKGSGSETAKLILK